MPIPLLDVLSRGTILLGDGAMGTQLQKEGLPPGACGELWNVEQPERVKAIQARYRDAGSDLILTNTFGGTRIRLDRHGVGDRTAEINRAAARLAREVMGPDKWVIGDIGPFGGILEPLGEADPDDVYAAFVEQARALVEGGVDAIIVETQTALDELELGIRAAREAGCAVVIASMAFDRMNDGSARTMMGVTPLQAAEAMIELGADILGCNCGTNLSIADHVRIVGEFRSITQRPIMAQPNAGQPEMTPKGIVYHETAEKMAERVPDLVTAGVNIVGGCCGTTPSHIALFHQMLKRP